MTSVVTITTTPLATATATISTPHATATISTTPLAQATATISTTTPLAEATPAPTPAPAVPEARAYYAQVPGQIHQPEPKTSFQSFHENLRSLQEVIALNPENQSLDVSACTCRMCPYSTGLLSSQRFMLLRRAYQINYILLENPNLRDEFV